MTMCVNIAHCFKLSQGCTDIEQMAQETLELKEKIAAERQASDDTAERRAKEQGWYHQITELNLQYKGWG